MNRVKSGTGHWHELAKLLPALNAAGYDGLFIEQETGVTRATQTTWTGSMQVRAPDPAEAKPCTCPSVQYLTTQI